MPIVNFVQLISSIKFQYDAYILVVPKYVRDLKVVGPVLNRQRGCTNFQKFRSQLKILGARWVT